MLPNPPVVVGAVTGVSVVFTGSAAFLTGTNLNSCASTLRSAAVFSTFLFGTKDVAVGLNPDLTFESMSAGAVS